MGLLISIDGPAGAGKSTLLAALIGRLSAAGARCTGVRAPSDEVIGRLTRAHIDTWPPRVLTHLMAADRYHTLATVIAPALDDGQTVITDRYLLSSYVMQYLAGVPLAEIEAANQAAPQPDIALVLTGRAETIAGRLAGRGPHCALHRRPGVTVHELDLYDQLAPRVPARLCTLRLDVTHRTPEQLAADAAARVLHLLGGLNGTGTVLRPLPQHQP